jgi:hypothetical protein
MPASCGSCAECCRLLEIEEIAKPWNSPCRHAREGVAGGCCSIYENRPASCAAFRCLYLASQTRSDPAERLDVSLRPDRTHVVFYRNGTEIDRSVVFAHVDPGVPLAWQDGAVHSEIMRLTARGATVIVVVGELRVVIKSGQPPLFTTEAEILRGRQQDVTGVALRRASIASR